MNRKLLIFFVAIIFMSSCKKREGEPLTLIKQDMQEMGYNGTYEKPSNAMERAALGFVGVNDFLLYSDSSDFFLILEFKEEESGILTQERLVNLIKMASENSEIQTDQDVEEIINNIDDHYLKVGKTSVFWKNQKPEDIIKVLKTL